MSEILTKDLYIQNLKNIILSKFYNLDIIKYGNFKLKSGVASTVYIDFRKLVSYTQLYSYLETLTDLIFPELFTDTNIKLMPIPIGGIPFGSYLSYSKKIPYVIVRDKIKNHGTGKILEGNIDIINDKFIIIEDVITSGKSILETLETISRNDYSFLNYKAIFCICNRNNIEKINDLPIYSLFTLSEIEEFINKLILSRNGIDYKPIFFNSKLANELYLLALKKKSNIILSCDSNNIFTILNTIRYTGHLIVGVKLHLDNVNIKINHTSFFYDELTRLKKEFEFIVIEDAKFADIEVITVEKINSITTKYNFIDAITIHSVSGLSILESSKINKELIIVCEMSSSNNLLNNKYIDNTLNMIRNSKNIPMGLVCQNKIPNKIIPFEYLTMSPGINIDNKTDDNNQNYTFPDNNINKRGLFWIVGRAITNNEYIEESCEKYKNIGWKYFLEY